jgi:hypothetical protein
MTQYISREGYKSLRIGRFRIVYAKEKDSCLRNITAYLNLNKAHMFDLYFTLPSVSFNYNKL